jgi:hypothetical protein
MLKTSGAVARVPVKSAWTPDCFERRKSILWTCAEVEESWDSGSFEDVGEGRDRRDLAGHGLRP